VSEHKTLIGYARVSTRAQDLALQLDALERTGCERVYRTSAQGRSAGARSLTPAWTTFARETPSSCGALTRLGRSLRHLVALAGVLHEREIAFRSLTEAIDTNTRRAAAAAPVRRPGGVRARADPRAGHGRARGRPRRRPPQGGHAGEAGRRPGDARSGRATMSQIAIDRHQLENAAREAAPGEVNRRLAPLRLDD
jgi:hypothetical protein